jgi:AcrR family transcriptional regulator
MKSYSTSELTKHKIIQAAGELIGDRGLDNVSTRAVAERAGENIGSIHYHFGSKSGLFRAVLQEAISGCLNNEYETQINAMTGASSPEAFAGAIRLIVQTEVRDLFRTNRPDWHAQLIYQVLQRDDDLYDLMGTEMMLPNLAALTRFFRLVKPELTQEEAMIHFMAMMMPIFSHATYMRTLRRLLNVSAYSEAYLQKLEDVLVRQTQLLLGLPEDA